MCMTYTNAQQSSSSLFCNEFPRFIGEIDKHLRVFVIVTVSKLTHFFQNPRHLVKKNATSIYQNQRLNCCRCKIKLKCEVCKVERGFFCCLLEKHHSKEKIYPFHTKDKGRRSTLFWQWCYRVHQNLRT